MPTPTFDRMINKGRPDDVCHMCLTSGTTGLPKGAMMTHRNYINMGVQLTKVDPLRGRRIRVVPAFCLDRRADELLRRGPGRGMTINFPESVETAMEDLCEIGPHFMFGAPRIYETLRSQIWLKIDDSYWLNRRFTIIS